MLLCNGGDWYFSLTQPYSVMQGCTQNDRAPTDFLSSGRHTSSILQPWPLSTRSFSTKIFLPLTTPPLQFCAVKLNQNQLKTTEWLCIHRCLRSTDHHITAFASFTPPSDREVLSSPTQPSTNTTHTHTHRSMSGGGRAWGVKYYRVEDHKTQVAKRVLRN